MSDTIPYLDGSWGEKPAPNKKKVRPVCKDCGTSKNLKKDKRRAFGVEALCNQCFVDRYKGSEVKRLWHIKNNENERRKNGYLVIDGGGILQDGAFLHWFDVHSPNGRGVPDGTVIKRMKTGKVFEVWNKPILTEIGG